MTDDSSILLHDDFSSLRPGALREHVDGPFREMHAQPASPEDNLGGWSRRFGWWTLSKTPWQVVDVDGARRVESTATATVYDNVHLAKGDRDWRDVRVETTMTLLPMGEGWGGPAGVLFRFLDSRRHYAACVDADGCAKLLKRDGNNWEVMASTPAEFPVDEPLDVVVEAKGSALSADIGGVKIACDDGEIASGGIGLVGARPVRFAPVTVTALAGERERLDAARTAAAAAQSEKRSRYGAPVAWKKIETPLFGAARRIRLGDLTGDGRLDFLLLQLDPECKPALACLTAMSADGEVMWQRGTPVDRPPMEMSSDGPAQIHDVDGDGRCEVVCVLDDRLQVLDGATGETKLAAPLPPIVPFPDVFKRNMLDWGSGFSDDGPTVSAASIAFADLAGRGFRGDILVSDNYHTLVALDGELDELWRTVTSHGHFPQVYDFDGDGRDNVLAGYQRLSPDGEILGRVCLQDHQDAIYVGPLFFSDDGTRGDVRILMAGGEDGLLRLTPRYDIGQRVMGHVQRLSVGHFREDVPGLCVATCLYHGNPGIVSLFDATLKRVWKRDFPVVGSTLQPVNWDGSGVELMLLSGIRPSQGYPGGLIDGDGDLVVPLGDDGGPGLCAYAHDFDGDGLDELMLWDRDRIWIYHCDRDAPARADGKRYRPRRPALYNTSNFQSYWSHPHWE